VDPSDLPAWAEQQAAEYLSPLGNRWLHTQGVVAQALRVSVILDPADQPYLVAAAWLHDVGYSPRLHQTGFHPIDGARWLRSQGAERLARLVSR
jgi:HD superfamily phosphodiesterase